MKLMALSGLAAGGAGSLTACGTPASTPPGATGLASPGAAGGLSGANVRGMIIQFFYTAGLTPQIPGFEQRTGINVEIEQYGVSEQFRKADIELASRSSAYDVISLNEASLPRAVKAGWIEPLDKYIQDPRLTDKGSLNLEGFFDYGVNTFTRDGKLYGLPTILGLQLMYVRKDLFAKAGLQIPTTFDGLLAAAKQLHGKDGVVGVVMRTARGRAQNVWSHLQFLYGFGGKLVANYPEDMRPTLDSPEMIAGVEYLRNLLGNYSLSGLGTLDVDAVVTNFVQGNAAIFIEGAPHIGRITDPEQSKIADKIDVSVVPGGPAGVYPPIDAHAWVIPSAARNKEASWSFANWATSQEVQLEAGIRGPNAVPTRRSVVSNPEFRKKWDYAGGNWLQAYEKTLGLREDYYGSPSYMLPIPEWPELGDRLAVALSEAVTGQKSPTQAMKDAQSDATRLMKEAGYF
jgi:ABC-type glycerol-3-phosphate transport system substrate-binding protein